MEHKGTEFYDNKGVFDSYMKLREKVDNANDCLDKPIIMEMLGNLENAHILDLGCGDGRFGLEVMALGAASYLGLEGSKNMYERAERNLLASPGKVELANIEEWKYPERSFDIVVSRLVLHYIDDVVLLFKRVYGTLKSGGTFTFSIEHPVNTACTVQDKYMWTVSDYFRTGKRVSNWLGEERVIYHRTVEDYFTTLQQAGFMVMSLKESKPQPDNYLHRENYEKHLQHPLFLYLTGKRLS